MREFLRKHVSRRLLALSEGEVAGLMKAMRQLGVGSQGRAEGLANLHQFIYDEWPQDPGTRRWQESTSRKNCFGMIEWKAVRKAAAHFLPKHIATAEWKQRNLFRVEQEGLPPMPKDRGAVQ